MVHRGDEYADFVSEGVMVNTAGLMLTIMTVIVVFLVTNPNYRRQPLPEELNVSRTNWAA